MIIFQEHQGREGIRLPSWEQRYRWALASFAHAVVANTDAAYREITEVLRVNPRRVFRATLLVPPDRSSMTRRNLSHDLQPIRRPVFLFVGQLIPRKNVGALIDAAESLRSRRFEFEVWVVGEGPERDRLQVRAGSLIDSGVVRFIGALPHDSLGTVHEMSDVFVMPSSYDYRSVAVLEAMRFGKPVIDSVHDGNASDLVKHGDTGLLFNPHLPRDLEAAMERAITEPTLLQELGQRAEAVMDEHTPQTAAAALMNILHAVETGRPASPPTR